jgi:hypothetical protein
MTQQGRATTLTRLGITPRRCPANSRGEAIPVVVQHCVARPVSALRHCAAYPCTANTPRPRRGAGGTLEYLLRAYTGPRRDVRPARSVIPVTVNLVRPSPPLPHHAKHYGDIPTLRGQDITTTATVPRTGPPSTEPSNHSPTAAGQPTATLPPSKPLLYGHRTHHDASTGAGFARMPVSSAALFAIPPHIEK